MKKLSHILISEWVVIVCFIVLSITTLTQVIFRYAINFSLAWTEELSGYAFIWLVFTGIVVSFVRGEHASVGFVMDRFKGKYKIVLVTIIDILIYILFLVLLYSGLLLMNLSAGQSTSGLGIPKMLVYGALPFGSALMVIELTLRLYKRFTGRLEN